MHKTNQMCRAHRTRFGVPANRAHPSLGPPLAHPRPVSPNIRINLINAVAHLHLQNFWVILRVQSPMSTRNTGRLVYSITHTIAIPVSIIIIPVIVAGPV